MPIDKTIKSDRDYGCVEMHLDELMDRMQIKRNTLARGTDLRFEVIRKWYDGEVEKMVWTSWRGFAMCWIAPCRTFWNTDRSKIAPRRTSAENQT